MSVRVFRPEPGVIVRVYNDGKVTVSVTLPDGTRVRETTRPDPKVTVDIVSTLMGG